MGLQIAILGSIEPRLNEDVVGVPPGKQRALLTLLAIHAPHPVSAESAADALWPQAAPAEAMRNLQVTVSRLRRSLGAAGSALETVPSGYRLAVEPDAIDARRFETLIDLARATRLDGDGTKARRLLDDALGLWRGPALADVGGGWTRSSGSSPRRSCGASRRTSCDKIRRSTRAPMRRSRTDSPRRHRFRLSCDLGRRCRSWDAARSWAGLLRLPTGRAPTGGRSPS